MIRSARLVAVLGCVMFLAGCGGDAKAPKVAAASGKVTFKGSPLAGATVTFYPEKGPLAMGVTDMNGEFKLNSGALAGCAVGPAKASIRVETPGDSSSAVSMPASNDEDRAKKMAEMTTAAQKVDSKPKSLIPAKYRDPEASLLSYTVDADSSKNKFNIELTD